MNKKFCFTILLGVLVTVFAVGQKLNYYLPDIGYDERITTPDEFLGWQVGEWHVSHDLLRFYMERLAEESDRISIENYAYSHEQRPLQLLTITSPENHKRIDEIQQSHIDISENKDVDLVNLPAVVYQGYSIHGNESSGSNAAMLVAYYLAAGQSDEVLNKLDDLVILFDPCYNPDGLHRFSSWVNSNRYTNLIYDNQSREFNEPWPRGRTNHYLFDLNRDWLLLTHPESRGRVRNFHKWKPNVLTDHHEMGTDRTFFFQPGIPSRTNPNTPKRNQELTEEIGKFHAQALDEIGSLYYSKESYDDFYYGKGSTYPDAHGCIGILFEQASSRGHLQESINGVLSFPFTIRNQVKTSLSTQKAAVDLREDLLKFKQSFYQNQRERAKQNPVKAYVFHDTETYKLNSFIDKLIQHDIKVYELQKEISVQERSYKSGEAFIVPLDQKQYTLTKSIFEKVTTFNDSLFYDVSAWTMPLAFDIEYDALNSKQYKKDQLGKLIDGIILNQNSISTEQASYAYIIPWDQYQAPAALYRILADGIRVKIISKAFETMIENDLLKVCRGSIIVPLHNQRSGTAEIHKLIADIQNQEGLQIFPIHTGSLGDIKLGSPGQQSIELPRIALLAGDGTNSYDVGEVWHHLDVVLSMPFTMLDVGQFKKADLGKYNVIIMAEGNYNKGYLDSDKLKKWLQQGGTLMAFKKSIDYLIGTNVISAEKKGSSYKSQDVLDYSRIASSNGAQRIGGTIFNSSIELDHPLGYGYVDAEIPMMKRGTSAYNLSDKPLAVPASYTSNPLLSGYVSDQNLNVVKNSAAIMVHGSGKGKIISFVDNILFRGYWYGGHRLFANAIFYHDLISGASLAR